MIDTEVGKTDTTYMLLSDILGQASNHHSIIGGGMPPVLLSWRPEPIYGDSQILG